MIDNASKLTYLLIEDRKKRILENSKQSNTVTSKQNIIKEIDKKSQKINYNCS